MLKSLELPKQEKQKQPQSELEIFLDLEKRYK